MTDNFTREKLPHLYQEVFNKNPAGVAVLDHLWSQFMDAPGLSPNQLDALRLAYNEGQRSVIRFIMIQRDRLEQEQQVQDDQ